MILEKINAPNDIHQIPLTEFPSLAEEIRTFILEKVSKTGGHLSSNLGVVELTLALHNVLHFPEDKLIWDVGHQSYTHKILTGRKEGFDTLRQSDGMSGFPKRQESFCDSFDTGHSSTSISAGIGYVQARDLKKEKYTVVSVIGDGSLTGGMAYEALNNAAELKTNFIIVLNDNEMSISRNVGGMSTYLSGIRTAGVYAGLKNGVTKTLTKIPNVGSHMVDTVRKTKSSIKQLIIPGMLFENMGLTYLGPVDGTNMRQMMKTLNEAKRVEGAVVVHVVTKKGRGYGPAEKNPSRFHGIGPFDLKTGRPLAKSSVSWTDVFSGAIVEIGEKNPNVVAVTAAMPEGTGLKSFGEKFPTRFFDVGIAEEHAVTFAAGMALGGMTPVVAVYSSFFQRAVDQILHDVCMQNLHVVLAVDRAGLVGADGETHQGCFDLSYLSMMPNMTVMAPKNRWELQEMLRFAVGEMNGPAAIRYPRGSVCVTMEEYRQPVRMGRSERICSGDAAAILAIGTMVETARRAAEILRSEGIHVTVINARFMKPLDTDMLASITAVHGLIVTLEENTCSGGFGQAVAAWTVQNAPGTRVRILSVPDRFIPQGDVNGLLGSLGLDAESVSALIRKEIGN